MAYRGDGAIADLKPSPGASDDALTAEKERRERREACRQAHHPDAECVYPLCLGCWGCWTGCECHPEEQEETQSVPPGDELSAEIDRVVKALHAEVGAVGREAHLIGAVNVYRGAFHEMTRKWCGVEIDPSLTGIEELLVAMLRAW